jgi:sirohydrochlorin ferrochelatase
LNEADSGLLLVAHGTRSQFGIEQFLWLTSRLRDRLPNPVEPAFLELAKPTIDEAVGKLIERGIQRLVTMPLLLFAAGHAKDDVPSAVHDALRRCGRADIERSQAAHFGCHEALVALSQQRMEEALQQAGSDPRTIDRDSTRHLLVGRGSRDDTATAEMREFARLCSQKTGLHTEVAFMAMASPLLAEQLRTLPKRGYKQIIVQPHLLFHGDLIESLKNQVAQATADHPTINWLSAAPLADPPGLAGPATKLLETVILGHYKAAASKLFR